MGEDRQVLPDDDILRLARLVRRVFTALGHCETHQDVEWVFDGSEFILVQSRPVTALLPVVTIRGSASTRPTTFRYVIWIRGVTSLL